MATIVGRPSPEKLRRLEADLRREMERLYGGRLAGLVRFGSQARGDARGGSDIDILIVLRDDVDLSREVRRVGPVISSLDLEYDEDICPMFASESEYTGGRNSFLANARREGIAI